MSRYWKLIPVGPDAPCPVVIYDLVHHDVVFTDRIRNFHPQSGQANSLPDDVVDRRETIVLARGTVPRTPGSLEREIKSRERLAKDNPRRISIIEEMDIRDAVVDAFTGDSGGDLKRPFAWDKERPMVRRSRIHPQIRARAAIPT